MIYFPPVFDAATADQMGRAAKLERWRDDSGQPIGWKRLAPTQPAGARVLIIHGNACAAVQCSGFADVIQKAAACDVYFLEFPGYADRPGKPTEKSLEAAALDALPCAGTNGPLYVVGESLGTGVAACLAGQRPDKVAGLALLAPYNSLTSVAQWHAPVLPVHLLLADRYPAAKFLQGYQGPLAVFLGGEDLVVPEKFGRRLYDGYQGPKRLWEFPAANHDTLMMQPPEVWSQIFAFLQTSR